MTRIDIAKADGEFSLLCQGHAGYASVGNDIVCAAISTLTQTLIKYMMDRDIPCNYKVSTGYLWIYGKDCMEAFDAIVAGLEMIEYSYPQYVEISKGCTIFIDTSCDVIDT